MAMHIPKPPGFLSMLKEGALACLSIAKTTRSTYGPCGLNKIVINHIGKQFITNDAATILRELEIAHPAAKILVMASQQQDQEAGDGTNIVFQLAGSFLEQARDLLKMRAMIELLKKHMKYLMVSSALLIWIELVVDEIADVRNISLVKPAIRSAIMSKQVDFAEMLSDLVSKACSKLASVFIYTLLQGSGVMSSQMINGMVFKRDVEGDVKEASNCKVVIYSCPLDSLQTETKGTVLLHTADELTSFSKGEEAQIEKIIASIRDAGAKVIVSGGKIGELTIHYANKF
ncbi:unnamed protein product, partial [Protopolystoma xenopodis]